MTEKDKAAASDHPGGAEDKTVAKAHAPREDEDRSTGAGVDPTAPELPLESRISTVDPTLHDADRKYNPHLERVLDSILVAHDNLGGGEENDGVRKALRAATEAIRGAFKDNRPSKAALKEQVRLEDEAKKPL